MNRGGASGIPHPDPPPQGGREHRRTGAGPRQPSLRHAALTGLAALLVGIGLSRFAYPPLIPALVEAHWFTAPEAAYLGATNFAGYVLGAGLTRRMAERLPVRALFRSALLVGVAAFIASAAPLGFWWTFTWRLASGVIGGMLMVLAVPTVLAAAPPALRGRIGGVMFTGVGLGITISGTLVPWLVRFGLPEAWISFGIASALLAACAWNGLPQPPPLSAAPAPEPESHAALPPAILLLIVVYGIYGVGFVPHTVFWVDYIARALGEGLAAGSRYWALLGIGAACGPLLCGIMADRLGFRLSLRLGFLAMGVGIGLPLASTGALALALSSLIVGGLGTGLTALASGRVGELVPVARQRQAWGWMTVSFSIVYAACGYAMSFLFARTHSYRLLFAIGAGAMLLGLALDLAGGRRRR